jgi:ectoine hydroxylase-related dioxygenase (phytanoyl-CoA dioxygenase family)
MTMTGCFSDAELASFQRDGFVVVRGLFTPQYTSEVGRWIDELAARPPEYGKVMAYYEDSSRERDRRILSRLEYFREHHAGLKELIEGEPLCGRLSQLLGDRATLFKEKINFKLPGGAGFTPHQDLQTGWDDYASYFITTLVTIDPSTRENGCLELAAGHHRRGKLGTRWKPLEGDDLAGIEFVHYPMEPGDVAFFDCYVPHQSAPNHSLRPRRNLYLTYNRASEGDHRERYFADKRASYPPDHEREVGREYAFRV